MSGEPVYSKDGGVAAGSSEPDEGSTSYWEMKLAAKDREIAALREALTPFADAHFYYMDAGKPDDCPTGIGGVTYGDFRRAVSVLAALEGNGEGK
jgi:hypothetical protein